MGFECIFSYYEWKDKGYDKDNVKTMKKKVGDPYEETLDSELASTVLAQMARRDVLVIEVEIYELSRKKISFAPTKEGVKIRNKVYSLDLGNLIKEIEAVPEEKSEVKQLTLAKESRNILRYEIFDPEDWMIASAKNKPFTLGKSYPIFQEKIPTDDPNGYGGMNYWTIDDRGSNCWMSSNYFIPKRQGLINENAPGLVSSSKSINLSYGNVETDELPVLRGR